MSAPFAFGLGISTNNRQGEALDCYFPAPLINPNTDWTDVLRTHLSPGTHTITPEQAATLVDQLPKGKQHSLLAALTDTDRALVSVLLDSDQPIDSTPAAYLKLHLLSHRLALPNSLNLDGIFAHLPNVVWTNRGAIDIDEYPAALVSARLNNEHIEVSAVDKFPRMTNYVLPTGVRIADASRIRLGAYLGEGTTVMHEGFINFNAGALGPNMVEGRISQGVILQEHTDLGGGASTMGTLSGGGEITITIGKHCLIGANAGTGIPLGDRCTIEAGLYITAGTVVTVLDERGEAVETVKARQLAGGSDMLFIRHGQSGQIQCRTNRKAIELNKALHAHN